MGELPPSNRFKLRNSNVLFGTLSSTGYSISFNCHNKINCNWLIKGHNWQRRANLPLFNTTEFHQLYTCTRIFKNYFQYSIWLLIDWIQKRKFQLVWSGFSSAVSLREIRSAQEPFQFRRLDVEEWYLFHQPDRKNSPPISRKMYSLNMMDIDSWKCRRRSKRRKIVVTFALCWNWNAAVLTECGTWTPAARHNVRKTFRSCATVPQWELSFSSTSTDFHRWTLLSSWFD